MKLSDTSIILLFLTVITSHSFHASFKSVLKNHNTQAQSANENIHFHIINEIRVCENYKLNDPNFLERLKTLRYQIKERQCNILKNENHRKIKLQEQKQKEEKIQFYRSATAILGFSSVGVGINQLHNNAKHWHS